MSAQREVTRGQGGWRVIEGEPSIEVWEVTEGEREYRAFTLGLSRAEVGF